MSDYLSDEGEFVGRQTTNSFQGTSHGPVVQAGDIHGSVFFQVPAHAQGQNDNRQSWIQKERFRVYSLINDLLYRWSNVLREIMDEMRHSETSHADTPSVSQETVELLWGIYSEVDDLGSKVDFVGSDRTIRTFGSVFVDYYMTVQKLDIIDLDIGGYPWARLVTDAILGSRSLTERFKEDLGI